MRRLLLTSLAAVLLIMVFALPAAAAPGDTFPELINLPNGWAAEGIATGRGTSFYAGSLANGAIYRGDLRTGEGEILVPGQAGSISVGLKVDQRSNALFVAGGPTSVAKVYDADSGAMLASYPLVPAGFINDVTLTQDAAYFTNSAAPYLYRLPIGPGGRVDPAATPEAIPLHGDWNQVAGFNANGIASTANGKALIVVNSTLGEIYKVDPATGEADLIDLGGTGLLTRGDGILLQGQTLYVVRNRLNLIAVVELAPNLLSGTVTRNITDSDFDVPTTIALHGSSLYAVNARFGTPVTPNTEYQVVKVSRN